jgi:ABC-type polysaccharide/polyol phosphate export permease
MSPLLTYLVQGYVFRIIFKIQVENYFLFLLFGLSPWIFLSQTIDMSTGLLYNQSKLLKSLKISPVTLLAAQAFDNLINSLLVVLIVLLWLSFFGTVDWSKVIFFPLPYLAVLVSGLFLSFFLATCQIFFFDTKFVTQFVLGILYFLTPIVYPENFVPEQWRFLLALNPLTYLLRPFRTLMEEGLSPKFLFDQLIAFAVAAFFCVVTLIFWARRRNAFYLRL